MKQEHPSRERLIDLVERGLAGRGPVAGDLGRDLDLIEARRLVEHLASCAECRAYVDSLKATFDLAGAYAVPEQPDAYWSGFEANVRRRVQAGEPAAQRASGRWLGRALGSRWRLALALSPGLAVALALVVALALRGPEVPPFAAPDLAADLVPPLDDMSVSEIARSMSEDAIFADVVREAAADDISSIEQYLLETEDIGDLLDGLADDEAQSLAATLAGQMNRQDTRLMSDNERERT